MAARSTSTPSGALRTDVVDFGIMRGMGKIATDIYTFVERRTKRNLWRIFNIEEVQHDGAVLPW